MSKTATAMRLQRVFATPLALSLAAHAVVVAVLLLLPGHGAPLPAKVIISNVSLEVRASKVEVPPRVPPLPHEELPPPPAPVARKKPVARVLPPRQRAPEPKREVKLTEVHAAPIAVPKLGIAAELPAESLEVAAGDPHGDPHGHPHLTAPVPAIEPALTTPAPTAVVPKAVEVQPPPRKVVPPPPRALVPARLLSQRPRELEIVKADYPEDARRAGLEGVVVLSLLLDEAGRVVEARVRKGLGFGLDEAARAALLKSRFTPAIDQAGAKCRTRITYHYVFTLD